MMYSKGDVVIVQFPFSDLVNAKKRPMVVLAEKGEDLIGCAITSNPNSEGIEIPVKEGNLVFESKIKYWQINTFMKSLAIRKTGRISAETHYKLLAKVNQLFKR